MRYCRDISLNIKYIVLLNNVRDKKQFSHLARQAYPENSASLYEAHLDATKQPHECFLLDLLQDTDGLLRFRTNRFPKVYPLVIYAPVINETMKSNYYALKAVKTDQNYVKLSYQVVIEIY